MHYKRWSTHGDPLRKPYPSKFCTLPGCDRPLKARGMCGSHYKTWRMKNTKTLCTLDGCNEPHVGKGYCSKHYKRFQATGSPDDRLTRTEIMTGMMSKSTPDACVVWPYTENNHGYGYVFVDGVKWTAHRYALYLHTGENPKGMMACHEPIICHNRACINPYHLRWDTQKNNIADKVIDDTINRGEKNNSSKLKEVDIPAIRSDRRPAKVIALDYEVSESLIYLVKARKVWAWVPEQSEVA